MHSTLKKDSISIKTRNADDNKLIEMSNDYSKVESNCSIDEIDTDTLD